MYATGDINRDGKLDVISYDQSKNSFVTLLGKSDGTFTEKVPSSPLSRAPDRLNFARFQWGRLSRPRDGLRRPDQQRRSSASAMGRLRSILAMAPGDFHQTWSANIGAGYANLRWGCERGWTPGCRSPQPMQTYNGTGNIQVFLGNGKGNIPAGQMAELRFTTRLARAATSMETAKRTWWSLIRSLAKVCWSCSPMAMALLSKERATTFMLPEFGSDCGGGPESGRASGSDGGRWLRMERLSSTGQR